MPKFQLITRQDCLTDTLRSLEATAVRQEAEPPGPFPTEGPEPMRVRYQKVVDLGQDFKAIATFLGDPDSTAPHCSLCGEHMDRVVRLVAFSEDDEYGEEGVDSCSGCLQEAVKALNGDSEKIEVESDVCMGQDCGGSESPNDAAVPHICPFKDEVHGNNSLCVCCTDCTTGCAQDI